MAERISQPSRNPTPRKERTEVRFALSYEALKMKSISSATQISAIFFAIRQTNFSDSITHGPRMNTGSLPPMTTLPTLRGLAFIDRSFSQYGRLRSIAPTSAPAVRGRDCIALNRKWQMAHTARERTTRPVRAFAEGKAATNRKENSKSKMLPVYAVEIRSSKQSVWQ